MHIKSNHTHTVHWEKIISLTTKHPTLDHIEDVVKSPLKNEWYDSILSNYEKMATSTTLSAPFLHSLLPPKIYILRPIISVRVKKLTLTTNIIYTQEHVKMDHPCLKILTLLYLMHL